MPKPTARGLPLRQRPAGRSAAGGTGSRRRRRRKPSRAARRASAKHGDRLRASSKTSTTSATMACADSEPPASTMSRSSTRPSARGTASKTATSCSAKRGQTASISPSPSSSYPVSTATATWAVVVCLVGGGQEINTGEAGIAEWLGSIERRFPDWDVHVSPVLGEGVAGVAALKESARGRGTLHEACPAPRHHRCGHSGPSAYRSS